MEQNRNSFEIELWADKAKMKRILYIILFIAVLAWAAHFIGSVCWDKYSVPAQTLRGTSGRFGWPVTLYWWGMFIGIIAPGCFVLIYFILNKKAPSLALDPTGLFINQQLIGKTLVPWNDISRIEKEQQGKVSILHIYFKNPQQIIEQQSSSRQVFLKENLKDGEPLKCDNRLLTGDFDGFFSKAQTYLKQEL